MDLVAKKPHVKRCAERFGQLPASPKSIFYKETIIHGEYCDHDRNEILALKRRTINPGFMRVRHIPTRSHNVISMFAADKTSLDSFTDTCITSASRENERSEEHTSELQSLMRISYAVFCLKKKKQEINQNTKIYNTNNKKKQH